MAEPFEALETEVARVAGFLDGLSSDDWLRPTRCPPMTVLDLAAHAWRGGIRINEMLDAGPVHEEPQTDGSTYFQYDPATIAQQVVRRAQETSASLDARTFPQAWRGGWAQALSRVRETLAHDDPVLPGVFGTIRLTEYLRTRCVEVTIHHMDLRDAVGLDPDPSPQGLATTSDVLRGLLGTDLRPLGMDDVRFALVGTGRGDLTAAEREMLGPLSDSFPLLQ